MEIEISKLCLISIGAGIFAFLIPFENKFPARAYKKGRKKTSYSTNLLIFITNNIFLVISQITGVYVLASQLQFNNGLTMMPWWWQAIISIIILDFAIWAWHFLAHKSDLLWALHKCHHSEKYLNVTSAIRFHTGELVLAILFKSVIVVIFGIPLWIFMLYEMLITFFAAFHHANIRLPRPVQKVIEIVFITPDMHRSHHSTLRSEHDSNYGVIFSWWDKIFSTYNPHQPKYIGIKGVKEKNILSFLLFPFKRK